MLKAVTSRMFNNTGIMSNRWRFEVYGLVGCIAAQFGESYVSELSLHPSYVGFLLGVLFDPEN
jgi:hypothetical protein